MKNDNRFPLKKTIIATIIILLCALMVLSLLAVLKDNDNPKASTIFVIVWACCFSLLLIGYWIYQIIKFKKKKEKCEKKKK